MADENDFDSVPIEVVCPECGETIRRTVGWLMDHSSVTCSQGHTTELDVDSFREEIRRSESEWRQLRDSLSDRFDRRGNGNNPDGS